MKTLAAACQSGVHDVSWRMVTIRAANGNGLCAGRSRTLCRSTQWLIFQAERPVNSASLLPHRAVRNILPSQGRAVPALPAVCDFRESALKQN